jgi:hypothetical protein
LGKKGANPPIFISLWDWRKNRKVLYFVISKDITMTEHPCNCSTCPKYSTALHPIYPADLHYCDGKRISEEHIQCTKRTGCLSHPQAREYLNKEVIEELELRRNFLEGLEPERGAENWTEMKTLEKVIKLLKEGV